jgi:very-short-patch-repair endonuclease
VTICNRIGAEPSLAHRRGVGAAVIDELIGRRAAKQHGLVTRSQLLAIGSARQIQVRVRRGSLIPMRTGVFRIAGAPSTWEQHLLGAVLAGGTGAMGSFRSAAWHWRLEGFDLPDQLEITVPRQRRARLPGVMVHDSRVAGRAHRTVHHSIPVTSPARTLCDLTACCGLGGVARAVDDALRRKLTTVKKLERVFLDLANQGRRRSTFMRALLEERLTDFEPGESRPEARIYRWIVAAGLPKPKSQHWVRVGRRNYRLDLAYPELKVGIEYDGWDAHRTRTSFDADAERDVMLEDAGWRMLHFTSKSTRSFVVEKVANALAERTK